MTTPADDTAVEDAFEAYLAGRPVPAQAAGLAVFAETVRATATRPGRPNAALAELLATGLLTDQSSPSARTATSAGTSPSRGTRTRNRRRFAMIFPALLAKLLSAGAVAQAATGAGIVVVVATGAGATGVLGEDVQDTIGSVVGVTAEDPAPADTTPAVDQPLADESSDPGLVQSLEDATTVPVEPTEAVDAEAVQARLHAWVRNGPEGYGSIGEWIREGEKDQVKAWLRSKGVSVGSVVSGWANGKGIDEEVLVALGIDVEEPEGSADGATEVTPEPETVESTQADDSTDDRGNGNGKNKSHGNGNGNGNGRN
jgi:hypothetical protein